MESSQTLSSPMSNSDINKVKSSEEASKQSSLSSLNMRDYANIIYQEEISKTNLIYKEISNFFKSSLDTNTEEISAHLAIILKELNQKLNIKHKVWNEIHPIGTLEETYLYSYQLYFDLDNHRFLKKRILKSNSSAEIDQKALKEIQVISDLLASEPESHLITHTKIEFVPEKSYSITYHSKIGTLDQYLNMLKKNRIKIDELIILALIVQLYSQFKSLQKIGYYNKVITPKDIIIIDQETCTLGTLPAAEKIKEGENFLAPFIFLCMSIVRSAEDQLPIKIDSDFEAEIIKSEKKFPIVMALLKKIMKNEDVILPSSSMMLLYIEDFKVYCLQEILDSLIINEKFEDLQLLGPLFLKNDIYDSMLKQNIESLRGKSGEKYVNASTILLDFLTLTYRRDDMPEQELLVHDMILEYRIKLFGGNNSWIASSHERKGDALYLLGKYEDSLVSHESAFKIRESLGNNDMELFVLLKKIGQDQNQIERLEEALQALQKALEILKRINKSDSVEAADVILFIGEICLKQERIVDAIKFISTAIQIYTTKYGNLHPKIADCYLKLGEIFMDLEEYDNALSYFKKALLIYFSIDSTFTSSISKILLKTGEIYEASEQYDEALKSYTRDCEVKLQLIGESDPSLAETYEKIASILIIQGKESQAVKFLERSIDIQEVSFGVEGEKLASSYGKLATSLYNLGEYPKAKELFFKAIAINMRMSKGTNPEIGNHFSYLGAIFYSEENFNEAIKYYGLAFEINKVIFGVNSPNVAQACNNLATAYGASGNHQEALDNFKKCYELTSNAESKEDYPSDINLMISIGSALINLKRLEEAKEWLEKARSFVNTENFEKFSSLFDKISLVNEWLESRDQNIKKSVQMRKTVLDHENSLNFSAFDLFWRLIFGEKNIK